MYDNCRLSEEKKQIVHVYELVCELRTVDLYDKKQSITVEEIYCPERTVLHLFGSCQKMYVEKCMMRAAYYLFKRSSSDTYVLWLNGRS